MKQLVALIAVAGSLLAHSQTMKQSGEIKGTVVDGDGAPIAMATVYAVQQDFGLNDALPRSVKADRNGAFDFRGGFALGSYKLYAKKVEDSYPDPLDSFYADPKTEAPLVELSKNQPSAATTVKLRTKGAVVAGRVVDANTGAPIKARLGFLDGQGHGHSVVADGDYRILVPAGKEVRLMVTLLGPQYDRSFLPVAPLKLEPGQYVYLDLPVRR